MNKEMSDNSMYSCSECQRIVWLMEAGASDQLECCDKAMEKMSDQEKKQYLGGRKNQHPEFTKPGSP